MEPILKYRLDRKLTRRQMCDLIYKKLNFIINPRNLRSYESGNRQFTEIEQQLIDRYFIYGKTWRE